MPEVAVAGSDSCSKVEQKEVGAVPAFYEMDSISHRIGHVRHSSSDTMLALKSEKGKSTESTIISFQAAALRWKPAPGSHAGRCFTD
jgi:hypothetical protein